VEPIVLVFSGFLIISALAKCLSGAEYESWIRDIVKNNEVPIVLAKVFPIAESMCGVILFYNRNTLLSLYITSAVSILFISLQVFILLNGSDCKCMGKLSARWATRVIPSFTLLISMWSISFYDERINDVSIYRGSPLVIIWFLFIFLLLTYLIIKEDGDKGYRMPTIPRNDHAERVALNTICPLASKQLGVDDRERPILFQSDEGAGKANVFLFVSEDCRHCQNMVRDIYFFSICYEDIVRIYLFIKNDLPGDIYSNIGKGIIVRKWLDFIRIPLEGYPACVAYDSHTTKLVGPLLYGDKKIRILLTMIVNAVRERVAIPG
jgi:hypothetical protein